MKLKLSQDWIGYVGDEGEGGVVVFNASVETSYDVHLFNLKIRSAKWFQGLWVNTFLSLIFHSSTLSWV